VHLEARQGVADVVEATLAQQPAGGLGHRRAQGQADAGGHRAESEDEAPVDRPGPTRVDAQDHEGDDVGEQDPDGDHPLLEHRPGAAPVPGGVFGDVGRGDGRVGADRHADHRSGDEQHGGIGVTAETIAPVA
jgi:hypothetical protein